MKKLKIILLICLLALIGSILYVQINESFIQQHGKKNVSIQPAPTTQTPLPPRPTLIKPEPDVFIDAEPYNPQVSKGNSIRVKIIVGGVNVTKGDEIYFDYTVRLRYPDGTRIGESIDNPQGINLSFNPQSVVFPETYEGVSPYRLYSNLTITVNENAPSGYYTIYFGKARNEKLIIMGQAILFSLR